MFDVGAVVGRLELNIAGWQKSVETVKKDQTSLSGLILRHEQGFKSFGKTLTITGGAIVASFGAMIKKTADYGDEMNDLSKRTGVAVPVLTSLSLAAQKSGTSMDGLATGFRLLANNMQAANSGNKTAAALFDSLGIKVTNADGSLRDMNDVMFDVADRFAGMEDGAQKAALAQDLFGRSGTELIPLLNLGADGLRKEREEATRLGLVLSKEAAEAADNFNDQLASLGGAVKGLGIQIGTALMPAVQGMVSRVTNIIAKVREWAAEHPGLASGLSKVAFGLGAMAMAIGPVLYALPGLIKGLQTLKALTIGLKALATNPIAIIVTVGIIAGIKAISDFKKEFQNMRDSMKEAGASGFEAFLEGVNSGWRRVALGIKDSNVALSEANALARLYATEGGRGMKDVLLEEESALDGLGPAISALTAKLKELGVKTKTELTEELTKAEEALKLLKGSAEAMPGSVKALEDQIAKLKEQITGVTVETKSLAEQLGIAFRSDAEERIRKLNEALVTYRGKLTADEIKRIYEEIATLTEKIGALKGPIVDVDATIRTMLDGLDFTSEEVSKAIADMFSEGFEDIKSAGEKVLEGDLPAYLRNIPEVSKEAATETKSVWQEVSTVIADSMRNIASTIVGMFNFKGLFGVMPTTPKFDSSYYDDMIKAAEDAYEKEKSLIEASSDARIDAARRAFDAQELLIKRQEEDQDRAREREWDAQDLKYERQYENQKRAIENSKMTEKQKQEALQALEIKYENAKVAREQRREDARIRRERRIEDARLARELAHEKKIEDMRAATLTKLLDLQNKHETDMQAIRDAEELARQAQADAEEKRQNSLWFKVKGIFATACENMATIFLTTMFKPVGDLIKRLAEKLTKKGAGSVADALDGTGEHVKGLGATIGEFISGIGQGIGGFISGLATGIGAAIISISSAIASAMVALATGIASAATIIAAAAPAIIVTSLLGLGIMAGLNLLKRIFSSGGAGAGDGMGRVVERQDVQTGLLTMIRDTLNDNIKTALWTISTKSSTLKDKLVFFNTPVQNIRDHLKTIASKNYLKDVVGYLKKIEANTATGFASGGIAWTPQFARVAENGPEIIMPLNEYRAGGGPGAPITVTMPIYLGTEKIDERTFRIAQNRVEWLHQQYKHLNRHLPAGVIGGP